MNETMRKVCAARTLAQRIGSAKALALTAVGLGSIQAAKAASDVELLRIPGVGHATIAAVRRCAEDPREAQ